MGSRSDHLPYAITMAKLATVEATIASDYRGCGRVRSVQSSSAALDCRGTNTGRICSIADSLGEDGSELGGRWPDCSRRHVAPEQSRSIERATAGLADNIGWRKEHPELIARQ